MTILSKSIPNKTLYSKFDKIVNNSCDNNYS